MDIPMPVDEAARLEALLRQEILDTPQEPRFDRFVQAIAALLEVPSAVFNLLDRDRQWFKARVGIEPRETPRSLAFCAYTILGSGPLVVEDLAADPRFAQHPMVTGPPRFRFYAGMPVRSSDGQAIGTLAVLDLVPRKLDPWQLRALELFAGLLQDELDAGTPEGRRAGSLDAVPTVRDRLISERMSALVTLAAGVAHEINNPLTYVMTNLDYVLDNPDGLPKAQRQALVEASVGLQQVCRIVRDLHMMSRPGEPLTEPVDVLRVLESAIAVLHNELRYRARLVRRYEEVPPVIGRSSHLGQVFINLLLNAVQAVPEGEPERHEVLIQVRTAPGEQVVVEIRDTGEGIDARHLQRIFDPFFTTRSRADAKGLGLSVARGLVQAMGGELAVRSVPGEGTSVRVTLPAGEVRAPPAPKPVSTGGARRGRVLVVDDEPLVARAIERTLRDTHDTEVVTSATTALERLQSGSFDAVLCDLMMPEMSGMDLFDEVSARDPGLASRFVFITGGVFTRRVESFLQRVHNPTLLKPLDRGRLLQEVGRLVSRET